MKESKKIGLLCQLRDLLELARMPTVRDAGLSEEEARELANDGLIELVILADDGLFVESHGVERLTAKAFGILSRAGKSGPIVRAAVERERKGICKRISRTFGLGIWDLVKVFLGGVVGWYLKKHFP
jgi:hypothetical protein